MDHKTLAVMCREAYKYDNLNLDGGTQGIFGMLHGRKTLALRGTQFDFEDILRDIRATPWWSFELGGFCHAGFYKAARATLPVAREFADGNELIITGHSLGGGVGRILAGLMPELKTIVVTFGEPRSMFGSGDGWQHPSARRFVNGADCVPSHPWPIWGYRHQTEGTKIGTPGGRFTDHKIQAYIDNL